MSNPLAIHVSPTPLLAAKLAADAAAAIIRACIREKGQARLMVGTGNSQLQMVHSLVRAPGIEWDKVEAFHLDEYVGISRDHPASFRYWIRNHFAVPTRAKVTHYIEGDAPDLDGMLRHYAELLRAAPVDLAFVGIGENGHIAFNDPHVADFADPLLIKRVTLDEACRRQQVGEGHFRDMGSVPAEAISVTCPGLFRAEHWVCCVPDRRKAQAVRGSLEGPLSVACPGSLVQNHPSASVYLDLESASLLSPDFVAGRCQVHELASLTATH
jgi:glucosamine-6-phosphate deaminase